MSHGPKEITSTQLVLDAARDLHAMGEEITREGLVAATGLKQHIVDERLRVLCGDDRMKRIGRGAFVPGEQYHEARAMSKTLLPSGEVKYEVGDQLLELTSYEDGVLMLLACGPIHQMTLADATRQAVHCRIGSSETAASAAQASATVHCRIGSSETVIPSGGDWRAVHCRIGSSEILASPL